MNSEGIPPVIGSDPECKPPRTTAPWRWWLHLAILSLLPLLAGLSGLIRSEKMEAMLLPSSVKGLLIVSVDAMVTTAILFGLAWLASRFNRQQLMLKWRGSWQPVVWGFVGSMALRVGVMVIAAFGALVWFVLHGMNEAAMKNLRPQSEHVVDTSSLTGDPLYFFLTLTLISFVVAGLREELWRAGMLAGLRALFPKMMSHRWGEIAGVCIVAVLFGLGHTLQGFMGVILTTLLGIGLGLLMVRRKSIWEAVIAHGFFDASTFLLLYVIAKYSPEMLKNMGVN
jgi:membrane protease YdiL (CAAX protease family)